MAFIIKKLHNNNFEYKLLSKNANSEVYDIYYKNYPAILKIYRNEKKFFNEVKFLQFIKEKSSIFPLIIKYENLFQDEGYGYIIENKLSGDNLLECYNYFNEDEKINILVEAAKKLGYLNSVKINLDDSSYDWKEYFFEKIPKWIKNISDQDNMDYQAISSFIITKLKNIDKKTEILGIIHRDYGFRNLLVCGEKITGIVDFEHAMIGDILFDTTKFIFNNIDFFHETEKVNIFLNEWKKNTKVTIFEENFWIYLAIQGLGVIQWVDAQKEYEIHREYRKKGKKILLYSLKKLKFYSGEKAL